MVRGIDAPLLQLADGHVQMGDERRNTESGKRYMYEKKQKRNIIGLVGWPEHAVPLESALTEGRYALQRQLDAIDGIWRSLCTHHPEMAAKLYAHGWSKGRSVAWLLTRSPTSELSVGELISLGRNAEAEASARWDLEDRVVSVAAYGDDVGHGRCSGCGS